MSINGVAFAGFSGKFKYDSSTAWVVRVVNGVPLHLPVRLLYFLRVSACLHDTCETQFLARVQWFSRRQDGAYLVDLTSDANKEDGFVHVDTLVPVVTATLRHIVKPLTARALQAISRRRWEQGPFELLEIDRKRCVRSRAPYSCRTRF